MNVSSRLDYDSWAGDAYRSHTRDAFCDTLNASWVSRPGAEDLMRRSIVAALTLLLVVTCAAGVFAQRRGFFRGPIDAPIDKAPPYDGKYTFARLKFTTGPGGYYFGGLPAWAHGYIPIRGETIRSEDAFVKILNAVSNMNPHMDGSRVVDVSDPDLFLYPVTYATEPGFMELSDKDVVNLREYLLKGGFIIFDDFRAPYDWEPFQENMRRLFPNEQLVQLDITHPIFHSFFDIKTLDFVQAYDRGGPAQFWGLFPNNDRTKPLRLIANFNNDVSQYWQWSDTGYVPVDLSNEAYKLGVNYVIYGLTH
jgi:hypothetical protein